MARETFIRIDRQVFRLVATVDEGQTLYFASGKTIAVERFDMRPGGVEFDYQINSREYRNGQPEQIAATRVGLDREFLEQRVKGNVLGLPLGLADPITMVRERRVAFTYGELRPQTFRSRAATMPVAWRIWFKRTWYSGAPNIPGAKASSTAARDAAAAARAGGSAQIGVISGGAEQRLASGTVGPLTNDAGMLRVYVGASDPYEHLAPYDRRDMIWTDRTLTDHVHSLMSGHGW